MESLLPSFQMPFQRRLSRLYNDTKKSSDFVKEPVQNEEDPEIKALHRKLRIQKDRLVSWGLEWTDSNQSAEIDESLSKAGLSEVVGSIMSTIKDILAEAEPLWQSSKHLVDSSRPSGDRKPPLVRWDKARFEDLVHDLTSSIDTLFDLSHARLSICPSRTSKSTMKSPTSEDFKPFESTRYLTPQQIDPAVLMPAKPAQHETSSSRSVVYMSKTEYGELTQASGVRQPWSPLLLEYAAFNPMFAEVGIMPDMNRFEKLSACLQQDPQLPSGSWTGLPRVLGYFEDMENARLGLVYRFPASFNAVPSVSKPTSTPVYSLPSLKEVMRQAQSEPPMEVKFRLAYNLANTIFDLHARGTTHGNIHDNNISFCVGGQTQKEPAPGKIDLRRPLLSSFDLFPEYLDGPVNITTRHPSDLRGTQSPPSSNRAHEIACDLYSLGLVLLSIGLWTRLEDLSSDRFTPSVTEPFLNQLTVRCGTLYMKAVQACLGAIDSSTVSSPVREDLLCTVQVKVSRYLEACCILDGVSGLESQVSHEIENPASSPQINSPKPSGVERSLRNVKSPFVSADMKPSRRQGSMTALGDEVDNLDATEPPTSQASKPEGKMRLYPHVPLAPHVVEKWNTIIMPQINQALRSFYKKHPESVEISLESIGPNPQATQPTVLVVCTSVGKVRAILKKRMGDLVNGPPGFGLKVCRGSVLRSRRRSKPVLRSMGERSEASLINRDEGANDSAELSSPNPKYQEIPANGASIGAWIGDRHLPPVSFGGLVTVDDQLYGMTVHHMLDDPDQDFGPSDINRSMANPEAEWLPDSFTNGIVDEGEFAFELSDSESETYSDTDLTSEFDEDEDSDDDFEPGDIPGVEPGCGEGYVVTQPALDDVDEDFFPSSETEDEDHLASHSLGEVYASSGIRRRNANGLTHEVDWALFQFSDGRQPSKNSMPQASMSSANSPEEELRPVAVAPFSSLPDMEVQCVGRTSGLQTGKILPALTSVKIYGRTSPSHTYQIASTACDATGSPLTSSYPMGIPGDSGAWIIEREQGHLCGHILAWSQRKHVAYICPMEILLQDIAETLEATEVSLPGAAKPAVKTSVAPKDPEPTTGILKGMKQLGLDQVGKNGADIGGPSSAGLARDNKKPLMQAGRNTSSHSLGSLASCDSPVSGLASGLSGFSLQSGQGIGVGV